MDRHTFLFNVLFLINNGEVIGNYIVGGVTTRFSFMEA